MKKALALLFLWATPLFAAPQPVGPIGFGKGLNLQTNPTAIQDDQTPDSCNCVSEQDGSLAKRFGSQRYIEQARSTGPVTGIYRAYASSGTIQNKVTLAVIGNEVVYSTTDIAPTWIVLTSAIHPNQNWSWETMGGVVYFTGDQLKDPIMSFNVLTRAFNPDIFGYTASSGTNQDIRLRAKYLLQKSNYLLYVNVADVTFGTVTYFPDRVYYSIINLPSSTTYTRFLGMPGEDLTGAVTVLDKVNFLKPNSVHELSFTILNLASVDANRDQELTEIVNGFGAKAPQVTQNLGNYYVMGSADGIRLYDGGRRNRLDVAQESKVISNNIKPLIDRIIRAGTYERMVAEYYKKREWLVFSYEDPEKSPRGRNNSIIVYDLKSGEWYPICGWLAGALESRNQAGDDGALLYGDSSDGYLYVADLERALDDARKEISIDTMDSAANWTGDTLTRDLANVAEGTASLRMWVNSSVTTTSITRMGVLNMGEFYDRTKVSKSTGAGFAGDALVFKLNTTNLANLTSLRVDLEVNSVEGQFDTNFTSVTISTNILAAFSSVTINGVDWIKVEVPLSSFPVRPDWTSFDSEIVPFANTLFYYGIRFQATGIDVSSVSLDDVRVAQEYNPVNFYRFTKAFNFNSIATKVYGQMELTTKRERDSNLFMDVYMDFGQKQNTVSFGQDIPKEIIVFGLTSSASITIVDDTTFAIKRTTDLNINQYYPLNGVATADHIYFPDRTNNRMVKMRRSDFVIVSTFGSLGSGTTNQNIMHQIDVDENGRIYGADLVNQQIKILKQADLSFITRSGGLGTSATTYHQPTGVTADNNFVLVADEGNYRWKKLSASTLGVVGIQQIDYNTIGETSLDQDEGYYYGAYNKVSEDQVNTQQIILEKRAKGNLELANRISIFTSAESTNTMMGDIAIRNRYIYIPFYDGINYYIQQRLRADGILIYQYRAPRKIFSVLGDAYSFKPSLRSENKQFNTGEGKYIQIKYYDSGRDNSVGLINQTFIVEPKSVTY